MPSYKQFKNLNDGDLVVYILESASTDIWQVRFKNPLTDNKSYVRKTTGFRNEASAITKALEIYNEYQARKSLNIAVGSFTFEDAVTRFADDFDLVSKKMLKTCHNSYWKKFFGNSDMAKVSANDISEYFIWRSSNQNIKKSKGWKSSNFSVSESTLKLERGLMRRLFNYCRDANMIHKAPSFPRKFSTWDNVHSLPSNKRRGRFDLDTDYRKIVQPYLSNIARNLDDRRWAPRLQDETKPFEPDSNIYESRLKWKNKKDKNRITDKTFCHLRVRYDNACFWFFALLIANSGIRPSEASKLRHNDIRLVEDSSGKLFTIINIDQSISKVRKHRDAICRDFHKTYERYLKYKKELTYRFNVNIKQSDFIFPSTSANGFYKTRRNSYNNIFSKHLKLMGIHKRHLDQYGIDVYFSAYSFRSFYISQRLKNGMDIYTLSKNVGTSPKTILKAYDYNENWAFRQAMTQHLVQSDYSPRYDPPDDLKKHSKRW
jgi:integrase